MKKLIALVLAALLTLGGVCLAAEWPEGCSPSQPYSKLKAVDLTRTMGYIMLYPRTNLTVEKFCDVLEMYLPRVDLARGTGMLHLYEKVPGSAEPQEVCYVNFANADSVEFRPLSETELKGLMWGSGTCVEIHLPKSLEFGAQQHSYFVLMDEGCFTAASGTVKSISITADNAWNPVIGGAYGISGLYYLDAPYQPKPMGTAEPEMAADAGVTNMYADTQPQVETATQPQVVVQPIEEAPVVNNALNNGYQPEVVGMDGEIVESADGMFGDGGDGGFLGADDGAAGGFLGAADSAPAADDTASAGGFLGADAAAPVIQAPAPTAAPAMPVASPATYVTKPNAGDIVTFDLIMGGDAVVAVLFSENGSVEFNEVEYTQTAHVTGTVVSDEVQWGVVFLNDESDIINSFHIGRG